MGKRREYFKIFFFATLLCCQCKSSDKRAEAVTGNTSQFPLVFNTEEDYPEKKIPLEEIADVCYVPLESQKECLLKDAEHQRYVQTDSLIFLASENRVYCFRTDGTFSHRIGRLGHGPGEYARLSFFCINPWKKEIYICSQSRGIVVYGFDGVFRRFLPQETYLSDMACISPGTLLLLKDIKPFANRKLPAVSLFEEISVEDGRHIREYTQEVSEDSPVGEMKNIHSPLNWKILKSGEDYILNDCFRDTIYTLTQEKNILPRYIQTPPLTKVNRYVKLETTRFALLELKAFRFLGADRIEEGLKTSWLWIDKTKGEIFFPRFTWGNEEVKFLTLNGEQLGGVVVLEAYELVEKLHQGLLTGRLKEIAAGLKDDSNPVLMLIKFRN